MDWIIFFSVGFFFFTYLYFREDNKDGHSCGPIAICTKCGDKKPLYEFKGYEFLFEKNGMSLVHCDACDDLVCVILEDDYDAS